METGEFRMAGRRRVRVRPDERVVAEHGPWVVSTVAAWTTAEWVALKAVLLTPARKNVFYLAWSRSTQSFKRNREWKLLEEHHQADSEAFRAAMEEKVWL